MSQSPVVLDTSAYVRMAGRDPRALAAVRWRRRFMMTPIVLGELRAGFAKGSRERDNRRTLEEFCSEPQVEIVTVDDLTADRYAVLHASLRRKGTMIPSNDLWIAASAMQHGAVLLTADRHFEHVEQVLVDLLQS